MQPAAAPRAIPLAATNPTASLVVLEHCWCRCTAWDSTRCAWSWPHTQPTAASCCWQSGGALPCCGTARCRQAGAAAGQAGLAAGQAVAADGQARVAACKMGVAAWQSGLAAWQVRRAACKGGRLPLWAGQTSFCTTRPRRLAAAQPLRPSGMCVPRLPHAPGLRTPAGYPWPAPTAGGLPSGDGAGQP